MDRLTSSMTLCMCLALCVQRLSMAAGSIFLGIAILLFFIIISKNPQLYKDALLNEEKRKYYGVIGIFLLTLVPSVIFSQNIAESIKSFAEMWLYRMMPFVIITILIKDRAVLYRLLAAFIVSMGIDCAVADYQAIALHMTRPWGFGNNPLNLAGALAVVLVAVIIMVLEKRMPTYLRVTCLVCLPIIIGATILGRSRGLWLCTAVLSVIWLVRYIVRNGKLLVITLLVMASIGAFFVQNQKFIVRLKSTVNITTDVSNTDRLVVWKSAANMIKDYPIAGVGLGNFAEMYDKQYRLPEIVQKNLNHSHNNYLQIGAEAGLLGLGGFLLLTFYTLFFSLRDWLKTDNPYSLLIFTSWLGFSMFGVIDLIVDASAIVKILWFLTGVFMQLRILTYEECQQMENQ